MIGQQIGRMPRGTALRRYPALGFLAVAALLAVALPSALTVPNAGPPTLAEFAPVPGQGTGAGGDVGRLGAGSSGGPGIGGGAAGPGLPDADPGQPTSNLKRCVGNPPRQTEDPLSPPCVAFFEGDNGGKTWRGVSRDEVKVVVYLPRGPYPSTRAIPPEGAIVDYDDPPSDSDFEWDHSLKIYARYFNERYQAYGRRIHLYGLYGPTGGATVIERRRADGRRVAELGAFATVPIFANPTEPFVETAVAHGVLNVGFAAFDRALYRRAAPLMWGVLPDFADQARMTAAYVCRRVAGGRARFSGNVTDVGRARVFGIAYTESARETKFGVLKDLVKGELRRTCGVEVAAEVGVSEGFETAQQQSPTAIAALRDAEVTTVILLAIPNTPFVLANHAKAQGWFPEWVIPGRQAEGGMDRGANAKIQPAEEWRNAFGFTYTPRWGGASEMHWSRSHGETCPGCQIKAPFHTSLFYDSLSMLFYGLQAAGPRLTPSSFEKGMYAIPHRPSPNAYTAAAYFSPGNYSYVKDAMEIWWDPSGQSPGDSSPGCYRLPRGGARARAGEWPKGDAGLFEDGPCNGDAPVA